MNSKVVLGVALLLAALVLASEVAGKEISETTAEVKSDESSFGKENLDRYNNGGYWGGRRCGRWGCYGGGGRRCGPWGCRGGGSWGGYGGGGGYGRGGGGYGRGGGYADEEAAAEP